MNLKIILRSILKDKTNFITKTAGLTIGIACFIIIYLFIQYEKSYDQFHAKKENIYRVVKQNPGHYYMGSDVMNVVQAPFVPFLKENFPEVELATRIKSSIDLVQSEITSDIEETIFYVDPEFLKLFSFPLLVGNKETALTNVRSIILTKKMADKYFGTTDAIGEFITIDEEYKFKVTGIIANPPKNSHIQFNFLVPFQNSIDIKHNSYNWNSSSFKAYFSLAKGNSPLELEKKINETVKQHLHRRDETVYKLQNFQDIYLNGNYNFELQDNGDKAQIYIFFGIGFFILLLAVFNYTNLSTVQSLNKIKDVGVRKIVGAGKTQLSFQIMSETIVYVLFSTILAVGITALFLPSINKFLDKEIAFRFLINYKVLTGILVSLVAVSLASGIAPAVVLTKFNPAQIIKKNLQTPKNSFLNLRSTFVVAQFVISMLLVIGTLGISRQLKFIQNKDLGFSKENIVIAYLEDRNSRKQYQLIKSELLKNSNISEVTVSSHLPSSIRWQTRISWSGLKEGINNKVHCAYVDENFFSFYNIPLIEKSDKLINRNQNNLSFILSKTAVEQFEMSVPIGQRINVSGNGEVVGVIDDIFYTSLHLKNLPLALRILKENEYADDAYHVGIKFNQMKIGESLSYIEEVLKEFSPNYPFEYAFFDERIAQAYASEKQFKSLVQTFSILAIIIACLGLFGLANFNMQKKIKEIGVRKVNGAKITEVLALLNVDMVKNLFIALMIAAPVGWIALKKWMEVFAYRSTIAWWIFAIAGITAVFVALLTVSYQSYQAARKNPVEALRYE